jgi:serum/glucocorticoid-regulated kinase 2
MYFVMPFIKGGELFHHIRTEKKFNEAKSRFYISELVFHYKNNKLRS